MGNRLAPLVAALAICLQALAQAPPSSGEQSAMIEKVRQIALDYSRTLPNFLCTQVTHFYTAKSVKDTDRQPSWQASGTLTIQLTFFEQKENYRPIMVNDKPTNKSIDQVGGDRWLGDFGSTLKQVFEPKSETKFTWEHWDTLNDRRAAVVSYAIDLAHTSFSTSLTHNFRNRSTNWAAKGQVLIDTETLEVLRITINSADMPPDFPARDTHLVVDYGRQKVADREFLLPLRSANWISLRNGKAGKGETFFTNYRKFTADTDIKFDTSGQP